MHFSSMLPKSYLKVKRVNLLKQIFSIKRKNKPFYMHVEVSQWLLFLVS